MTHELYDNLTEAEKRVLLTFDTTSFRKIYDGIWNFRGWTDGRKLDTEVYKVLLRGLVIEMPEADPLKKAIARKWLYDNGYGGW
ncbi:MAG: hypothetical protein J5715_03845 [Clostridiales bacterium]|nr:hypothetical protein [Clostridiales bacterium]